MGRSTRWIPAAVTGAVAVVLVSAAVVAADAAACDDPGRYEMRPSGVELVGGCLDGADLPVAPPPAPVDPAAPPNDVAGD